MISKKIKSLSALLIITIITGCNIEMEDPYHKVSKLFGVRSMASVLEISYEKTTYVVFDCDYEGLTDLDIAHIAPVEEKQRVQMSLMPDGSVNMIIEEMVFERRTNIPHQTLPNDIPGVHRTVIAGNTASFFDINGRLIGTQPIELPNQRKLVEQIREFGGQYGDEEIARTFAAMQGGFFEQNLGKMIAEAEAMGQLINHDERHVTLRVNFSDVMPGAKGASVMLVDKNIQKLVASVTYDENENLTGRMFFAYATDGPPIPTATRVETLLQMPSETEVWQIASTKIENMRFSINPQKNLRHEK